MICSVEWVELSAESYPLEKDTKGQGRKWIGTQVDRDTDRQGHRRTETQTDRDPDGRGQGHKRTRTGIQTWR